MGLCSCLRSACRKTWVLVTCLVGVVLPCIIIGTLIGIYFPRAPSVHAKSARFSGFSLQGVQTLQAVVDANIAITNMNKGYSIGLDPMPLQFYFPENMTNVIGEGSLEGGVIGAGQTAIRDLHAEFTTPISEAGADFLVEIIQSRTSSIRMIGEAQGFASILKSIAQVASKLDCLLTYHWDTGETSQDCQYKPRVHFE